MPRGPKPKPIPKPAKMGRPPVDFDWQLFERLCTYPLKNSDIAHIMGVSVDTISRLCKKQKGVTFAQYKEEKQAGFKLMIMQKQLEVAKSGNVAMLIWLGKQYLDQMDAAKQDNTHRVINVNYSVDEDE